MPEVYGYQLLGPLLHHGDYDQHFLDRIGSDMIEFEMAHGGSGVWTSIHDLAGLDPFLGTDTNHWVRLDWSGEWDDPQAIAGFDPMHGLMSALERNPEAAKTVLTGTYEGGDAFALLTDDEGNPILDRDGNEIYEQRLPRLQHLLTEREWFADFGDPFALRDPSGWANDWSEHNPGHAALGRMLEASVVGDPSDERAVLIAEQIVYGLNAVDPRPGGDLMPSAIREPVAAIIATYIEDVNENVFVDEPGTAGAWGIDATYPVEARQEIITRHKTDLELLLKDLGRDEVAQHTVRAAQYEYTFDMYEYYLAGEDDATSTLESRLSRVDELAHRSGEVIGALDNGLLDNERLELEERLALVEARLMSERAMSEVLLLAPHPGLRAAGLAAALVLNPEGSFESEREMSEAELERRFVEVRRGSQVTAEVLAAEAIRRNAPLDLPQELLVPETGEPIPSNEWGSAEREAWQEYLKTEEGRAVSAAVTAAGKEYVAAFSSMRS
ncbi:hypothetical protein JQS43_17945 [Natronosporangium hydrolyticum]|uniref:Uncharacterized protein n=1 Tax=Natronosporangium hydrolyticum TaxID=2811111 RepID=A0A895YDK5_9ACTN|nr:hypothetical protein [Natronosporangium hydrolyticum]QSB13469.1 hypothetical protein JQS43_17945 [Natronosporangium hydrolyticum]